VGEEEEIFCRAYHSLLTKGKEGRRKTHGKSPTIGSEKYQSVERGRGHID